MWKITARDYWYPNSKDVSDTEKNPTMTAANFRISAQAQNSEKWKQARCIIILLHKVVI